MLPRKLYHASFRKVNELKPGFQVTKKLVKWDISETNRFLYAVDDRETVEFLGLGSAIEKMVLIDRYQVREDKIIVHISEGSHPPSMEQIYALEVYIYTITPGPEQLWIKNNNKHNGLDNEWKTKSIIQARSFKVEKMNVRMFLRDKELSFIEA